MLLRSSTASACDSRKPISLLGIFLLTLASCSWPSANSPSANSAIVSVSRAYAS